MYYSAGTYESFAHPEKPQGVDNKSAYIIGTGLAGLTAAFYLVRDGQMKGERIHLLEKLEPGRRQLRWPQGCHQGLLYARRPRNG